MTGSFFFEQKTAYGLRISDWSTDVCSSDLLPRQGPRGAYLDLWRHRRGKERRRVGCGGRLHDPDAARRLSAALERMLGALADPKRRRAIEQIGRAHV